MLARNCQANPPETALHATDDDTTDWESICRECRQVDWNRIRSLREEPRDRGPPSITIRAIDANHQQLATSACKICRMLSILKPPDFDTVPCHVIAAWNRCYGSKNQIMPMAEEGEAVATLVLVPPFGFFHNYQTSLNRLVVINHSSSGSNSRAINPKSINYSRLRHLVQQCVEKHSSYCNREALSRLAGLRVIDISSRTVIEAPHGCKYVAVSYVWGQQDVLRHEMNLQRPPPLIEDAISVTLSMGYQYVWIDRYCIPQNDDQERQYMISRMDQVYSSASITIIDASGSDAQNGLPGVSNVARRLQQQVHIGNTTLLELPRGNAEVESSKWATRGWTYQEGYFSPRRLIFTPSQVLYICASTYGEESAYCFLGQDSSDRKEFEFQHLFPGRLPFEDEAKPTTPDLVIPLMEYSRRDLTYQHDSLNAFLGILNYCTEKSNSLSTLKILHVSWGVFAEYQGKNELRIRLDWSHKSPAQRRPQFPGWTWAGWGGPLLFTGTGITLQRPGKESTPLHYLRWQLFLNSKNGMSEDIWDLADHVWRSSSSDRGRLPQQPSYATQLQITCLVVPVCLQKVSLTRNEEEQETELRFVNRYAVSTLDRRGVSGDNKAVLQIWDGIYIAAETFLDQEPEGLDCIIGLVFASFRRKAGHFVITFGCLIARRLDEHLYERVGAVPQILEYDRQWGLYSNPHLSGVVFLDQAGSVLHEVRRQEVEEESPFMAAGQRQTIVLV